MPAVGNPFPHAAVHVVYEMNRSHLQMLLKKHGLHSKDFRAAARENKGKSS
jgi:hypothetical protein